MESGSIKFFPLLLLSLFIGASLNSWISKESTDSFKSLLSHSDNDDNDNWSMVSLGDEPNTGYWNELDRQVFVEDDEADFKSAVSNDFSEYEGEIAGLVEGLSVSSTTSKKNHESAPSPFLLQQPVILTLHAESVEAELFNEGVSDYELFVPGYQEYLEKFELFQGAFPVAYLNLVDDVNRMDFAESSEVEDFHGGMDEKVKLLVAWTVATDDRVEYSHKLLTLAVSFALKYPLQQAGPIFQQFLLKRVPEIYLTANSVIRKLFSEPLRVHWPSFGDYQRYLRELREVKPEDADQIRKDLTRMGPFGAMYDRVGCRVTGYPESELILDSQTKIQFILAYTLVGEVDNDLYGQPITFSQGSDRFAAYFAIKYPLKIAGPLFRRFFYLHSNGFSVSAERFDSEMQRVNVKAKRLAKSALIQDEAEDQQRYELLFAILNRADFSTSIAPLLGITNFDHLDDIDAYFLFLLASIPDALRHLTPTILTAAVILLLKDELLEIFDEDIRVYQERFGNAIVQGALDAIVMRNGHFGEEVIVLGSMKYRLLHELRPEFFVAITRIIEVLQNPRIEAVRRETSLFQGFMNSVRESTNRFTRSPSPADE